MLEDLFKNNKLEYVYLSFSTNIIKPMTLSSNIENLRYFYVNTEFDRVEIALNITKEYPRMLQFYKIEYRNSWYKYSGAIQGTPNKIKRLKECLIHEYEYTAEWVHTTIFYSTSLYHYTWTFITIIAMLFNVKTFIQHVFRTRMH